MPSLRRCGVVGLATREATDFPRGELALIVRRFHDSRLPPCPTWKSPHFSHRKTFIGGRRDFFRRMTPRDPCNTPRAASRVSYRILPSSHTFIRAHSSSSSSPSSLYGHSKSHSSVPAR